MVDRRLLEYAVFRECYKHDPVNFILDCFKWGKNEGPTPYQLDVAAHIIPERRVAVRAMHGAGKSALASWLILWFVLTRDIDSDWKVPVTASVWRQLTKFLFPELHKWTRKLDWAKVGRGPFDENKELLTLNLKLSTGEAFALASDDPSSIEGAHASCLFYVFDEAKAINDGTFDAAEGAFMGSSKTETLALVISTPGEPQGRFYDIHSRKPGYEDWWVRHINIKEAISCGRIDPEKVEQRKRQWGESSALFQNRVLGEFCANDETGVIPLAWVELANERWYEWNKEGTLQAIGIDVAGATENSDTTVFAPIYSGYKVGTLEKYPKGDIETATMEIAGRTQAKLDANPQATAVIDVIGIGAGVGDRLAELGYSKRIIRFIASHKSEAKDKNDEFGFFNKRSEMWWKARELLDPHSGLDIALPPDNDLIGELTSPHWQVQSGAKIKVESKKDIKKRIQRSTDCADAVLQGLLGKNLYAPLPDIVSFNLGDKIAEMERRNYGMD